ncbi:uncharacterized protein LOC126809856 isoform X1 [Patella vulgata]|uniref:uncharacterized protein LOC126809856 isoform X1 n=1 Tax=Patella vulgata TaxID=6465 RepID=UPI002180022A|nr:uncharacterized protein LOC126809856 isoform X1 [Patella vulgata]
MAEKKSDMCDPSNMEDLDELERSILSLCEEDNTEENITIVRVGDTVREEQYGSFHISPAKLAGIQLPVCEKKESLLKSIFHGTPSNLSRLSPIKADKLSCDLNVMSPTTPITLKRKWSNTTMINKFSSTPCANAPSLPKRLILNTNNQAALSSCYTINETIEEENNETFEDLLESVSILCDKPSDLNDKPPHDRLSTSSCSSSNVSQIDMDSIYTNQHFVTTDECSDTTIQPNSNIVNDENFFKTFDQTGSPFRGRFTTFSYSRPTLDDTTDDDELDLMDSDVSVDILGLDNFIFLDKDNSAEKNITALDVTLVSDGSTLKDGSTIIEETKTNTQIDDTTYFDGSTIRTKRDEGSTVADNLTTRETQGSELKVSDTEAEDSISTAGSQPLKRKLNELEISLSEFTKSSTDDEAFREPKAKERRIESLDTNQTVTKSHASVTEISTEDQTLSSEKEDELPVKQNETIKDTPEDNQTDSVHDKAVESKEKETPKTSLVTEIKQEPSQIQVAMITPLVHEVRIISPPPMPVDSSDESVVEVIVVNESIEVVDLTDDSQITTEQQITETNTINKSENQLTLQAENELIRKIKSQWGIESVHQCDDNLTSSRYAKRRTSRSDPSTQNNVKCYLEGSSRIPPLFQGENEATRSNLNKQARTRVQQGRSPFEIAAGIQEQILSIQSDCQKKVNMIESGSNVRCHHLTNAHKHQITMLRQKQIAELRNATRFMEKSPMNVYAQYRSIQLREDHLCQRESLRRRHNDEMRALVYDIEQEKSKIFEDGENVKKNLEDMINKLRATTSQDVVDPDRVHTTIDLYKGPCKSNHYKRSLVKVCLPADIASYMIREDEMYDMLYKYT